MKPERMKKLWRPLRLLRVAAIRAWKRANTPSAHNNYAYGYEYIDPMTGMMVFFPLPAKADKEES